MIELKYDRLHVSFPEVHKGAECKIDLLRTLRLPDDDRQHPLPPDLGRFPVRRVHDFENSVPENWLDRGGVLVPMHQSEALWLRFEGSYPFALKLGTQGINAINGSIWSEELDGENQDYLVTTSQPWLDGYSLSEGDSLRQFTALPLESDHGAQVQMSGNSDIGGLRLLIVPLSADAFAKGMTRAPSSTSDLEPVAPDVSETGISPGGQLRSQVFPDPWGKEAWEATQAARCYIRLCNSVIWKAVTLKPMPQTPLTEEDYESSGYPWVNSYEEPSRSAEQVERVQQAISARTLSGDENPALRASIDEKLTIVLPEPRANRFRVNEEPQA